MSDDLDLTALARRPWRRNQGRRVRLVSCSDPYTRLEPGAEGTAGGTDDMGTVHVDWDDGHHLGLIPGEDVWEWLS